MMLAKKIALVAGGTGALGAVIAERFVSEGARAYVSNVAEDELQRLPESFKKSVNVLKSNVTKEPDVIALFDEIVRKERRVDIVVNTVGGFLPGKSLADVAVDEWNRMFDINLMSAFLCTREGLRRMKGQAYGRIVNISAMVGLSPSPGKAPYAISKAAVAMLTDIVAQEVKGTGITVNAIAPSIIRTQANIASMPDEDSSKWVKPEEIADMICYLCSDAAGSITGTTLKAYGGV